MGLFWSNRRYNDDKDEGDVGGAEMLAELRLIRQQLERLGERIGQAATREDLKNYVTLDVFKHHLESHQKGLENWRTWLPWGVGIALAIWGPEIIKLLSGK